MKSRQTTSIKEMGINEKRKKSTIENKIKKNYLIEEFVVTLYN